MKTALIVVDVQKGLIKRSPFNVESVINNIGNLISYFNESELEVITIQHQGGLFSNSLEEEVADELKHYHYNQSYTKKYSSAFNKTDLDQYLKSKGIDSVVVVGLRTDHCIDLTCADAMDLGYKVIIPSDCNSTVDHDGRPAEKLHSYYNNEIFTRKYSVYKTYKDYINSRDLQEVFN